MVRLVVSYGQDNDSTSELLDGLERADVEVHANESTHSKVVVADDLHVLVGSANLTRTRTYRDLAPIVREPNRCPRDPAQSTAIIDAPENQRVR